MIVVAVAAILAWLVRSQGGRLSLILAGLLTVGLAVGWGLGNGLDRIAGLRPRRERKD
jgi:hypothetical protein